MRSRFVCFAATAAALAACSAPKGDAVASDSGAASEAPFAATGAQGAVNVVQTYYALLEAGHYGEARRLWSGGGDSSGSGEADFAAGFALYSEYHARIGAPGVIEGAAGSLYVEVPVAIHGRRKGGGAFAREAIVTLRRVNDVPGSSAEDRKWHIHKIAEAPDR